MGKIQVSHAARFVMYMSKKLGNACAVSWDFLHEIFPRPTHHVHVDLTLLDALMRVAGARHNSHTKSPGLPHWDLYILDPKICGRSGVCLRHNVPPCRVSIMAVESGSSRGEGRLSSVDEQLLQVTITRGGEHEGTIAVAIDKRYFRTSLAFPHDWNSAPWKCTHFEPALVQGREDILHMIDCAEIRGELERSIDPHDKQLRAAYVQWHRMKAAEMFGRVYDTYVLQAQGSTHFADARRQEAEKFLQEDLHWLRQQKKS